MAGAYGTKCPLTGIVIPHDWFRATRSEQRAPALDPLPDKVMVRMLGGGQAFAQVALVVVVYVR